MRPLAPIAFALALTSPAPASPAGATQEEAYHHGHLRFVEPGVTLQRADEGGAEEALVNMPFLPGDRVWTDASGRAEFLFPDATVVRLDRRSKLDYSGHEEERDERIVLRLWSGSLLLRGRERRSAHFEVETPGGTVLPREQSLVRVDVDAGEARISVYEGEALLDDGRSRVPLAEGERTYARGGESAADPTRFDRNEQDDFAQWDQDRESEARWASGSGQLPEELGAYEGELEGNGDWRYEASVGNVWVPQVQVGWTPYSNGHWSWTAYGWTWIPYERWGWAPHHYGSWGHSASFGWYWVPGRTWGPAWVNWAVGGGYVGWCPTGPHGRAAVGWGHHGGGFGNSAGNHYGHARGGRSGRGPGQAWSVVRSGQLGHRGNLASARLPVDRIDPGSLRVAESARLRPTRDGRQLAAGHAVPRAVSTRQRPGDFVRELSVDNKTTVPAPWTRGYGPPPAGVEGARYGTAREREEAHRESAGRGASAGTASAAPAAGSTGGTGSQPGTAHTRSVPWFRPTEASPAGGSETTTRGTGGGDGGQGAARSGGAQRRAPVPSTGGVQSGAGESGGAGAARPRGAVRSRPFWQQGHRGEAAPAATSGGSASETRRESSARVPFWRGPRSESPSSNEGTVRRSLPRNEPGAARLPSWQGGETDRSSGESRPATVWGGVRARQPRQEASESQPPRASGRRDGGSDAGSSSGESRPAAIWSGVSGGRQRSSDGEGGGGGYRPRSQGSGDSGGGARPSGGHPSGGGQARPAGGGEGQASGGGNAGARSRRRD